MLTTSLRPQPTQLTSVGVGLVAQTPDLAHATGRCADPSALHQVLLDRPDRLDSAEARWCLNRGIGHYLDWRAKAA
jgi:hypothetical protein